MISVEVTGRDAKSTWDIVGIYRIPNEDMLVIERLAIRTYPLGKSTKGSIIAGDLNLLMSIGTETRNALAKVRHI
jgi:hypothetical protein